MRTPHRGATHWRPVSEQYEGGKTDDTAENTYLQEGPLPRSPRGRHRAPQRHHAPTASGGGGAAHAEARGAQLPMRGLSRVPSHEPGGLADKVGASPCMCTTWDAPRHPLNDSRRCPPTSTACAAATPIGVAGAMRAPEPTSRTGAPPATEDRSRTPRATDTGDAAATLAPSPTGQWHANDATGDAARHPKDPRSRAATSTGSTRRPRCAPHSCGFSAGAASSTTRTSRWPATHSTAAMPTPPWARPRRPSSPRAEPTPTLLGSKSCPPSPSAER